MEYLENMKNAIKKHYEGEYIQFIDEDKGVNVEYVRFLHHSAIYIAERRHGGAITIYKQEGRIIL